MSGNRSNLGPKRFGVDLENPEVERRFRRIEEELHRVRGVPNAQFAGTTTRRLGTQLGNSRLAPPQIIGLTLDNTVVGAITVKWNPVRNPDLRRYRIDYDTDISFNSSNFKTAYVTSETTFNVQEGDTATTYYVRVRAETDNDAGAFSGILNTTSGNVTTAKIEDGAVTGILTDQITSFSPASLSVTTNNGTDSADYELGDFTIVNDLVFVLATAQLTYQVGPGDIITVEIREDGTQLTGAQYVSEYNVVVSSGSVTNTNGTLTIPGFSVMTTTTPGTHTYSMYIEIDDDNGDAATSANHNITLTPSQIDFTVWEPIR